MRNVIVWGRAVTNVLQQLRGKADGFDDWYQPWRDEMAADPLLKFLYRQRSEILKAGNDPRLSTGVEITSFSTADLPQPPPNARGFFIGDQYGGNGWEVELPDGTLDKIYVSLPEDRVRSYVRMLDAPTEHLGQPLADVSVAAICDLYVAYLGRLVAEAEATFG